MWFRWGSLHPHQRPCACNNHVAEAKRLRQQAGPRNPTPRRTHTTQYNGGAVEIALEWRSISRVPSTQTPWTMMEDNIIPPCWDHRGVWHYSSLSPIPTDPNPNPFRLPICLHEEYGQSTPRSRPFPC